MALHRVDDHWCQGTAHRKVKDTVEDCLFSCRAANCACVQFRTKAAGGSNCRWVGANEFRGLAKSGFGFTAYVREGQQFGTAAAVQRSQRGGAVASRCPSSGLALTRPDAAVPAFYVYTPPFDESALVRCYRDRRRREWPVDEAAWLHAALLAHPARVHEPGEAAVLWMPTFAALSEAAGTCAGTSHFGRMLAAANVLRAHPAFVQRPHAHLLVNGVESALRNPLGELGVLVSSRGGRAACLAPALCGAFKADRMLVLPWAAPPHLQVRSVRAAADGFACGRGRATGTAQKTVSVLFRGSFGASAEAQTLRVRMPLLRQIADAQISIVGSERLQPKPAEYLARSKVAVHRLKRMEGEAYARALARARYCLVPAGDMTTPGQRLIEAVAAGCVPILIGIDARALPLGRVLTYSRFTGAISRASFQRDPVFAVEGVLHKLAPQYPTLLRHLADARQHLLYGVTADANSSTPVAIGDVGALLLQEFQAATARL